MHVTLPTLKLEKNMENSLLTCLTVNEDRKSLFSYLPQTKNISKTSIDKIEKTLIRLIKSYTKKPSGRAQDVPGFGSSVSKDIYIYIQKAYLEKEISLFEMEFLFNHISKIENFLQGLKISHKYKHEFFKKIDNSNFQNFEKHIKNVFDVFFKKDTPMVIKRRLFLFDMRAFTTELVEILKKDSAISNVEAQLDNSLENLAYRSLYSITAEDYYQVVFSKAAELVFYDSVRKWNQNLQDAKRNLNIDDDSLVLFSSHLTPKVLNQLIKLIIDKTTENIADSLANLNKLNLQQKNEYKSTLYDHCHTTLWRNKAVFSKILHPLERAVGFLVSLFGDTACQAVKLYTYNDEESQRIKTESIFILPVEVGEMHIKNRLPTFIEPIPWDTRGERKDSEGLTVSILSENKTNSEYRVFFSKESVESYNILQKKSHIISKLFVDVLEELDCDKKYNEVELPFPKKHNLISLNNLVCDTKEALNPRYHLEKLKLCFLNFENKVNIETKTKIDNLKKLLNTTLDMSVVDLLKRQATNSLKIEVAASHNKRRQLNTHKLFFELFTKVNFYYNLFIDYRGRNYPVEYLFSRILGYLKYYTTDSEALQLTIEGFIEMLRSYYCSSLSHWENFEAFLNNNPEITLEALHNYFSHNMVSDSKKNETDFLYFFLLESEIGRLKEQNFYTSFQLERDMKSSGPTFLAMLFKNKELGRYTNLVEIDRKDFTKFLMENTRNFFDNNLLELANQAYQKSAKRKKQPFSAVDLNTFKVETRRILNEFEKEKTLSKNAAMFFFYGQQAKNRAKGWREYFQKNIKLAQTEERWLNHFADNYLNFLCELFPGFKNQFETFKECFEYYIEYSNTIIFKTIDGATFEYTLHPTVEETSSRFCVLSNKKRNFKRKKIITREEINNQILNLKSQINSWNPQETGLSDREKGSRAKTKSKLKKLERALKKNKLDLSASFLANFIHSIDASFIRIVTKKIYDQCGYIISPIHDCVMLHPNYSSLLSDQILQIFTQDFNKDLDDLFFKPSMDFLQQKYINKDPNVCEEFQKLIDKFKKNKGKLELHPQNIAPFNLFPFEHIAKEILSKWLGVGKDKEDIFS